MMKLQVHHNQTKEKISAKSSVKEAKIVIVFMLLFKSKSDQNFSDSMTRNYGFRSLKT